MDFDVNDYVFSKVSELESLDSCRLVGCINGCMPDTIARFAHTTAQYRWALLKAEKDVASTNNKLFGSLWLNRATHYESSSKMYEHLLLMRQEHLGQYHVM